MANYNYKRGYTVEELEVLLVQIKAERENIFLRHLIAGVLTPV